MHVELRAFSGFLCVLLFGATCSEALATPELLFRSPGPALNLPFEASRFAVDYGVNWYTNAVDVFTSPGGGKELRPFGNDPIARYFTSFRNPPNPNDTTNRAALPVSEDWLLKVRFRNSGSDFNDTLFLTRAKESLPGEQNLIAVKNNGGVGNWSIEFANRNLLTGLTFTSSVAEPVLHEIVAHYKAQTRSLDLWVDDIRRVTDYDVYGVDTAIDTWQFTGGSNYLAQGRTTAFAEVAIGQTTPITSSRSSSFGRDWVASHPFTRMGLVQREQGLADTKYRDAGFSSVLAWENRPGLLDRAHSVQGQKWHWHTGQAPLSVTRPRIMEYVEHHPGAEGILVWDEPTRPEFAQVAQISNWIKLNYPDLLVYGNVYRGGQPAGKYYGSPWSPEGGYEAPPVPYSYDHYLAEYIQTVRPDVLMFDVYPYREPPEGIAESFIDQEYFVSLESVRRAALAANIPYWSFVQTFESEGYTRYPSESDYRMQIFSTLAYGFTGIANFTFDHSFDRGLLEGEYTQSPTPLYTTAQQVNTEIGHLGETLKRLRSTGTRYLVGQRMEGGQPTAATLPVGVTAWSPGDLGTYIVDLAITNLGLANDSLDGDVLVGAFVSPEGNTSDPYFMLVNLLQDEGLSSAATRQSLRVDFDFGSAGISSLLRLNRHTGAPERVELIHDGAGRYHVTLELGGGEGDLFKFNTSKFVGIVNSDANLDGVVNTLDFNLLAAGFNQTGAVWTNGDFNLDGQVDSQDFNLLVANFGRSASAAPALGSVIPEPSFIAVACCTVMNLRRRRLCSIAK